MTNKRQLRLIEDDGPLFEKKDVTSEEQTSKQLELF